jgi:hypothetical protein
MTLTDRDCQSFGSSPPARFSFFGTFSQHTRTPPQQDCVEEQDIALPRNVSFAHPSHLTSEAQEPPSAARNKSSSAEV